MKSLTVRILLFTMVFFSLLFALGIRPVPKITDQNRVVVETTIRSIFVAGDQDIVFADNHSDRYFYINRGLELGLDVISLKAKLLGKKVAISYPKYWTVLDPKGKSIHLSKLELEGEVIFDESVD